MVDRPVTIIQGRIMQRETRNNKLANQTPVHHRHNQSEALSITAKGSDHTQIPTFRDDSRGGQETCSGIGSRSGHCTPLFFLSVSYNPLHRRFFPLILRRHKGIISVLISGSNKAGVLSFLMRAFWITLSCKSPNYNFFPSTRSFAREVLLIALLLSCSRDCYVFATSRCLVRFGDSLLPIHYLCCVDTMGFLVIDIGCPVIVTSELMFRGPKRAY